VGAALERIEMRLDHAIEKRVAKPVMHLMQHIERSARGWVD